MDYYGREAALSMDYRQYMEKQAKSIGADIKQSTDRIEGSIVCMQTGIQTAINNQTSSIVASNHALGQTFKQGFNEINHTLDMGFSGVSNQLGSMNASFSIRLDRVSDSIKGMSKGICDRLDAIHDIVNNPLLTQSRELYRRAFDRYIDGFFDDALEDIKAAVEKNKTDYISWFLMGKIFAFGAGKFCDVINLEEAIKAFTQAAKYNDPNVNKSADARFLEAEIYFYLGLAQYAQSNELTRIKKSAEAAEMLGKALESFEQSFNYSKKMLESLFNIVRCRVLQGAKKAALDDLEKLVLLDRNYCREPLKTTFF
jgi:TPR repeat protein